MEGVIAREREINWSEVHFHSAFKTRRHATQFGLSVGFLCMCLYLSIWVWTKAQVYDCVCVCQCVPMPHGPAVDLHRSPFIPQIYRLVFLHSHHPFSSLLKPVMYIQYFRQSQGLMASLDCVCVNVSSRCVSMQEREKYECVCVSELVCLTSCFTVGVFICRESCCVFFFPPFVWMLCKLGNVCGGQCLCLPLNYDITASHASLDVSAHHSISIIILSA